MSFIRLNAKKYSYEEVKKEKFSSLSDYELKTLQFCAQWLNQQSHFSINTSGSTGNPKTIILSREQMRTSAHMTIDALGLSSQDKSLVCLNTEFIAGKMMLVRGLEAGMEIYIIPPSANPFKDLTEKAGITFTALVPYQFETILRESPEKKTLFHKMKAVLIGGAPIHASLEERLQDLSSPIFHTFGMTETVSHIALRRVNGKERSENYKVLQSVSISVDARNCLIIHSPFTKEPVITNDVVELIHTNTFKWMGRIDHVINSGGIKIHPEKTEKIIERIFSELHLEKRFVIAGFPHKDLGEAVFLIIEDAPWNQSKVDELREKIKETGNKYEVPKKIFFIDRFKETPTGKIDRLKTKEMLDSRS